MDAREGEGLTKKRVRLIEPLDEEAEPILSLFLRFFPLALFLGHLAGVATRWAASGTSRHIIAWNRGTFLRWLGVLIRMAIHPLPNIDYHWRWPRSWPETGL